MQHVSNRGTLSTLDARSHGQAISLYPGIFDTKAGGVLAYHFWRRGHQEIGSKEETESSDRFA